ncbi:MAG: M48 family metallopeptidase [Sphingobacteriales bacterium]|nr:M48 family metallopeptidase [Sphingobacteriales bacterium]
MLTQGTSLLTILILAFVLFDFLLEFILDYRNSKTWDKPIPKELQGIYDAEKYAKARNYHKATERLSLITSVFSTVLIVIFLSMKGFAFVHIQIAAITTSPVLQSLIFFGLFAIVSDIIGLPFELYGIFVIEEKYGFNKMTWKTYLSDKIKGYLLGGVIGGILLSLFVWFYAIAGSTFWIYAWGLFTAFTIFITLFYTTLIVPIFNKLKPLEAGSLREKIEVFAQQVRFPLTNIFVIDGSKRSTKANAYFSGLGSRKTIVLFDTLINEQTEEELVSVLAHEVGHYKMKHIQTSMLIGVAQMGAILYILSLFINLPELSQALGLQTNAPVFHLGLIAFSLLYSPISTITGIFMNMLSRKNEFEADNYAKENTGTGEHLISALRKLSANNLSNLNPDKWYVFFHYSHPPLLERVRNLMKH